MPDRFFLNGIDPLDHLLDVASAGVWTNDLEHEAFLIRYAADIHLKTQFSDPKIAHSVPSVFARPIQFFQALDKGKEHPLYDALISQWRGLWAVFALQEQYNLTLTTLEYKVPKRDELPKELNGVCGKGDDHLRTILCRQLPQPAAMWERWWLIYCGGTLIGATCPWTLAYTPAQYTCPKEIPWRSGGGQLADPIEYFCPKRRGKSRELTLLHRWVELQLEQHEKNGWGMPDSLESQKGVIHKQLEIWSQELVPHCQEGLDFETLAPLSLTDEKPYSFFVTKTPLVRYKPIDPAKQAAVVNSDLLHVQAGGEQTIFLTRKGLDPKTRVMDSVFLDQVDLANLPGPVKSAPWKAQTGQTVPLPYLIAEEAFFPSKLLKIKLSDKSFACGLTEFAIPLTPLFFHYYSMEELRRKNLLSVSQTGNSVLARLRLPVSGRTLTVEKVYDQKSEIVVPDVTPSLAVWPGFFDDKTWPLNFGLFANPIGSPLSVAPLTDGGGILTRAGIEENERPLRIWQSMKPPIGFALFARDPGRGEFVAAGVVLRGQLIAPQPVKESRKWQVAVDFGTSNTNIWVKKSEEDVPEVFPVGGHLTHLTDAEAELAFMSDAYFFPRRTRPVPIATLLGENQATVFSADKETPRMVEDYLPRFWDDPYYLLRELNRKEGDVPGGMSVRSRIVQDVKWGSGGAKSGDRIRDYLRGLALVLTASARAEGVRDLTFTWAFPLSLPIASQQAMANFWESIGGAISHPTTMRVNGGAGLSESHALCQYLAALPSNHAPVRSGALSMAMDIGGGSCDIGFWSEKKLLDQVSLKLAGNSLWSPTAGALFTRAWAICQGTALDVSEILQSYRNSPCQAANALLRTPAGVGGTQNVIAWTQDPYTHPIALRLLGKEPVAESPWLQARTYVYVMFMGLAYYAGLHARAALSKTAIKETHLYVGGMGSSLLTWLGRRETVKKILTFAFREGLQFDRFDLKNVEVKLYGHLFDSAFPNGLKDEVAAGLLCAPIALSNGGMKTKASFRTIVGEADWKSADGKVVPWDQLLTVEELYALEPPSNYDGTYIDWFLHRVLPEFTEELNLDQSTLSKVTISSGRVQEDLRQGADELVLQPVFACELRALLDDYMERSA